MMLLLETKVRCPFEKVVDHFNQDLFIALKPPLVNLVINRFDGMNKGDEIHLEIVAGPIKKQWVSLITDQFHNDNEWYFIDEGSVLPAPLKTWHHKHRVIKESDSVTVIRDEINFSTNNKATDLLIYPTLAWQFSFRAPIYKKFFEKLD